MREKLTSAISWKNHEKAKGVNCTRIASYPVTATESMAQSGDVGHLQAQTQKISNKGGGGSRYFDSESTKTVFVSHFYCLISFLTKPNINTINKFGKKNRCKEKRK